MSMNSNYVKTKDAEREQIEAQLNAFLNTGGQVTELPSYTSTGYFENGAVGAKAENDASHTDLESSTGTQS